MKLEDNTRIHILVEVEVERKSLRLGFRGSFKGTQ